jgi:hypothetical protein
VAVDHDPVASIRCFFRRSRSRDEEEDLCGKRPPDARDPKALGPESSAGARRRVAPEVEKDPFDAIRAISSFRKSDERAMRDLLAARDHDASLEEAERRPSGKAGQRPGPRARPSRPTKQREEDREPAESRSAAFARDRPRAQGDAGDQRDGRRKRRRPPGTEDRADQVSLRAPRRSVTTASTR